MTESQKPFVPYGYGQASAKKVDLAFITEKNGDTFVWEFPANIDWDFVYKTANVTFPNWQKITHETGNVVHSIERKPKP